jgi:hypothetical protein
LIVVESSVERVGPDHPDVAVSLNNRAVLDWVVAQIDRPPSGAAGLEADFKLSVSNNDPAESSPSSLEAATFMVPGRKHGHCRAIAFRGKAWNCASAVKLLDIAVAATAIGSIRRYKTADGHRKDLMVPQTSEGRGWRVRDRFPRALRTKSAQCRDTASVMTG